MGDINEAFALTLKQREFEISQLTQRNNFFMIFQGVMIAGLIQSGGQAAPVVNFAACCLGIAVALMQAQMAAGAKFWQMRWERATRTLELWLLHDLRDHDHVFQFFTSDTAFLTDTEEAALNALNLNKARERDPLVMRKDRIMDWVKEDLQLEKLKRDGKWAKYLFSRLILTKPSVSRLPISVGLALMVFWFVVLAHSIAYGPEFMEGGFGKWLHLVPLK